MKGEEYLTKPGQYERVYTKGSSWVNNLLVLKTMSNGLAFSRCGFSVSKRVGKAVVRNRVKRLLREIMRSLPLEPGWDLVFIARLGAAGARYQELEKSATGLLSQARVLKKREYEEARLRLN